MPIRYIRIIISIKMHRDTRFFYVQPARVTTYNCCCFVFCSIVSAVIVNDVDEYRTVCLHLLHITITLCGYTGKSCAQHDVGPLACLPTMQYIHTNQVGNRYKQRNRMPVFVNEFCILKHTLPISKLQQVFLSLVWKPTMAFFGIFFYSFS